MSRLISERKIPYSPQQRQKESPVFSQSVWEWKFSPDSDISQLTQGFKTLRGEGVDTVYLHLNDAVDLKELPPSRSKDEQISNYYTRLQQYIEQANAEGIQVHALFGGKEWSSESYRYLNQLSIDVVREYNNQVPGESQLKGIHFDIEPFSLAEFESDPDQVIEEYLLTMEEIVTRLRQDASDSSSSPLVLGIDTPYWLDGQNGNISPVTRNQITLYPIFHVFHILDSYEDSEVVLMAYRNSSNGENGTLALVKDEYEYVSKNALDVRIRVGQELNNEEPSSITFYGKQLPYINEQFEILENSLRQYPHYSGLAVHELSSYIKVIQDSK